jgi:hypothetical protein
MSNEAVLLVLDVITIMCGTVMVMSRHFADGVIGKLAISTIVIASFAHFANAMDDWTYHVGPIGLAFRAGLALMFVWRSFQIVRCWCSTHETHAMKGHGH